MGGGLGTLAVVVVIGYALLTGSVSPGALLDEALGSFIGGSGDSEARRAEVSPVAARSAVSEDAARQQLSELRVRPAGSMTGYSREKFPHWSDAQEYGWRLPSGTPDPSYCDARDGALIRDGRDERVEQYCNVVSGRWFDPYGGQTYTNPSDIDIDHFVPLANAWRSDAASWSTAKRESFANVPRDLLSVDDGLNQSKGDKGPEAWKPPRQAYWCTYSKKWIGIKHYWKLSITSSEKSALSSMLNTCSG